MEIERRKKIVGYVRRGAESEPDVDVGVPLEVRLHRFKKRYNGGRKTGQNRAVGKAWSGIGVRCVCRGDVAGKAPPLQEKLKWR